jgi:hypothetical protein
VAVGAAGFSSWIRYVMPQFSSLTPRQRPVWVPNVSSFDTSGSAPACEAQRNLSSGLHFRVG